MSLDGTGLYQVGEKGRTPKGRPLRADTGTVVFKRAGRVWHLELGQMQPQWAAPLIRATIRLAIGLAFLNIAFGIVILVLILARQ
jgi:hypothetical protein